MGIRSRKKVWWFLCNVVLILSLCEARNRRRQDEIKPIQNANVQESAGRAKREGFVDLNSIPNMMRGFAQNLGRGFNNMVQHSQNLGHKVVHNVMHNMPTIIYGNWKPITNSKPSYPQVSESSYQPRPTPSYVYPAPTQSLPIDPPKPSFKPIIEPAKPIYTVSKPEPVFIKPEPVYVKPTPGPIYTKPLNEDSYGKPVGQPLGQLTQPQPVGQSLGQLTHPTPISQPVGQALTTLQPLQPFENSFTQYPAIPDSHPTVVSSNPVITTFVTSAPPPAQIGEGFFSEIPEISEISNIPDEYSQNPDHVDHIAGNTLFYKDLSKLHAKQKLVEGQLANYKPKPGRFFYFSKLHAKQKLVEGQLANYKPKPGRFFYFSKN